MLKHQYQQLVVLGEDTIGLLVESGLSRAVKHRTPDNRIEADTKKCMMTSHSATASSSAASLRLGYGNSVHCSTSQNRSLLISTRKIPEAIGLQ